MDFLDRNNPVIRALTVLVLMALPALAQTPAAPVSPTNSAPKGRAIGLAWDANPDTNVVDFLIQISSNRVNWSSYVAVPATYRACTISNLFAPVYFRAIAVNANLEVSAPSNEAAWLGDTSDVFYYAEEAPSIAGPFQEKTLLLVKSNATAGDVFTRLRIERKGRMVTLP